MPGTTHLAQHLVDHVDARVEQLREEQQRQCDELRHHGETAQIGHWEIAFKA